MNKRPWFQLHLSTAVVLMVVAGAPGAGKAVVFIKRGAKAAGAVVLVAKGVRYV